MIAYVPKVCHYCFAISIIWFGAGYSEDLLHATREFVRPSPIQAQCWPIVQSGRDLVGIAATGSGKTLAFGLPGLKHILAQRRGGAPAKGALAGPHPRQ